MKLASQLKSKLDYTKMKLRTFSRTKIMQKVRKDAHQSFLKARKTEKLHHIDYVKTYLEFHFEEADLSTFIDNVHSDCQTKQYYGVIGLRKSL